MTAPISVIVPTLNATGQLPVLADTLLAGLTDGLIHEMILSDGGSGDGIELVARELGAELIKGDRGRGGQIARAIAMAEAPWLLILHADSCLSENWVMEARRHMEHATGKAGWFQLRFDATGPAPSLVAKGANLRARILGLPYGDQGLLISRRTLKQVGGFPELPLMEDLALARRLRRRLVPLRAEITTSATRYQTEGWARRVIWNIGTLARYFLGVSPERLAKRYERKLKSR